MRQKRRTQALQHMREALEALSVDFDMSEAHNLVQQAIQIVSKAEVKRSASEQYNLQLIERAKQNYTNWQNALNKGIEKMVKDKMDEQANSPPKLP